MKDTERLIKLLVEKEELLGLVAEDYDELFKLLVEETKSTKETLDFYNELEEGSY